MTVEQHNKIIKILEKKRETFQNSLSTLGFLMRSTDQKINTLVNAIEYNRSLIEQYPDIDMPSESMVIIKNVYDGLVEKEMSDVEGLMEQTKELQKLIAETNVELTKAKSDRLAQKSKDSLELMIKTYGFALSKNEIYDVDFSKISDDDKIYYKQHVRVGNYYTNGDFSIEIKRETNLRYEIHMISTQPIQDIAWSNYNQGGNTKTFQITKTKLMEFLNKHSRAMKRRVNLESLLG